MKCCTSWTGFWWLVGAQPYQEYFFALPLRDLPPRLVAWISLGARQYTLVGLALALVGLRSWWTRGQRRWVVATALTFALYSLYALGYGSSDSYVYLLPGYLLMALWLAEGARLMLNELSRYKRAGVALGLCFLLAIPIGSLFRHYETLDLSADRQAANWADSVVRELPQGALLITGEDRHTFTLSYVMWVEGQRTDLLVVDGELWRYPWYADQVARRDPALASVNASSLEELVSGTVGQREVYLSTARRDLESAFAIEARGILWKVGGPKE